MTTKIQLLMRESDEKNTKKKRETERTSTRDFEIGRITVEDER